MNYVEAMKLIDVAQSNFPLLANRDLRDTARLWALSFEKESFEDMEVCLMRTLCTVTVFPSLGDLWKSLEQMHTEQRVNATQYDDDEARYKDCWSEENMAYGRECIKKIKEMLSDSPMIRRVV